jgi:large subunit ribosomal protein L10
LNRDQKTAVVEELATQIKEANALFAVDYRGISVPQAAELRSALREAGASFRIVKNSLTERAAADAAAESLKELLEGPTALTFVSGDVALAAKALADFARANDVLEFKGGLMDGAPVDVEQIRALARLPARDVLQGRFVGVLASPLTTLVRGLGSMVSGLAVALKQIEEQGLVGGEAETPAAEAEPEEPAAEASSEDEGAAEEAPAQEAGGAPAEEASAEEPPATEAETEPEGEAEAAPDETSNNEEEKEED